MRSSKKAMWPKQSKGRGGGRRWGLEGQRPEHSEPFNPNNQFGFILDLIEGELPGMFL